MLIILIYLLMEKKYFESISNGFSVAESRVVFLDENVYDFSVDCNFIDKSDIINIHKYLMTKTNIK